MAAIHALTRDILHSHEEAFCKHSQWLIRRALQLTKNDRSRAEDLVQEVFVQFVTAHTDLSSIQNVAAYLYAALHYTHISQLRVAARTQTQSLSILDENIADRHARDPVVLYQVQDELRLVCQYACERKQSSKAASVLILRFFHGYRTSEVAKVAGCTSQAIRQCLRFARNEARLFLENPDAFGFIDQPQPSKITSTANAEELLGQLRESVFRSRYGVCVTDDLLRDLYERNIRPTNAVLAHVVSCRRCLDAVNSKLGIPLLADRFGDL